jgi:hypothetical protein
VHSSLTLKMNLLVITGTGLFAALISAIVHPLPWVLLVEGSLIGVLVGYLQRRSLKEAAGAYRAARTYLDVRMATMSTTPGKIGVFMQWGLMIGLVATAAALRMPLGALAGYAAFMCVRDLVALPAVLALRKNGSVS